MEWYIFHISINYCDFMSRVRLSPGYFFWESCPVEPQTDRIMARRVMNGRIQGRIHRLRPLSVEKAPLVGRKVTEGYGRLRKVTEAFSKRKVHE